MALVVLGAVVSGDGEASGALVVAGIVVLVALPFVVGLAWRWADRRTRRRER
jgi:hypothetical protein